MNAMTKIEPTTHDRDAYGRMTIAELLDVHNGLAGRCGTDVLKSWKRAKPELIDRIEALDAGRAYTHEPEATEATEDTEPTTSKADDAPEPDVDARPQTVDEMIAAARVHGPEPTRTIGSLVQELLMDEALDYTSIVDRVMAEFPDAKTSVRSVASVAATMRRRGVEVPMRRGKKSAD